MHAMVLERIHQPLDEVVLARPTPAPEDVILEVRACGVCRTDLHVLDGEVLSARRPLVLGHEVVGVVVEAGSRVDAFRTGDRVGVPWLASTCGTCAACLRGEENLCEAATFTGADCDGGYAEYAKADARYCVPIPDGIDDVHAAPLLCAGLIGYRALTMTGGAARVGIYGFGAAGHIVAQVAIAQGREVFAFTREHDEAARALARELGCCWAGSSTAEPPAPLDAAILFAPAGELVPAALAAVRPGGVVICAGIHMTDIPAFPYALLWGERVLRSVANLTRADARAFFAWLREHPVRVETHVHPLSHANEALAQLRGGLVTGALVLVPDRLLSH